MEPAQITTDPSLMATKAAQRATWAIDPAHSTVEFAVKHMMITTVRGHFSGVTGTITLDARDITNSSVDVEIDVASLDTRDEKRDAHLRSPDFFDAERFPVITFHSKRIEPKRGDENTLRVSGDLTIRGVTREVALDVEQTGRGTNPWGVEVIGFEATTTINRKDYGLEWNVALETGGWLVGDEVKITLDIQAAKQG